MKIGIFTDAYYPHVSGVTTSIDMLQATLKKMGNEVFIVTANLDNNKFRYDEENKIIYLPGIKTGIYGTKLTRTFSRRAFKIIKTWNLDVIHSQTEFAIGYFSRKVSKKLSIPVIHTYHTLYEDYVYYVTHGLFDKTAKKIVKKLTKYYCEKTCEQVIVPTPKIKELFTNKYDITKNINIIPTGIDTLKFDTYNQNNVEKLKKKYKITDNDFIIGTVGRVAKEKSLDELIKSFKKISEINQKCKLLIVGDGPYLETLKKLSKELAIDNKVIFTGLVKYTDINDYYHLINIFTSFSKSETQGLTIIEALASSLPVYAIYDDSFKNTIENDYNGYLFNDEEEFVSLINEIASDNNKYKIMKQNAKNSVYKYSKEVFASECLKVYHKAIKKYKQKIK